VPFKEFAKKNSYISCKVITFSHISANTIIVTFAEWKKDHKDFAVQLHHIQLYRWNSLQVVDRFLSTYKYFTSPSTICLEMATRTNPLGFAISNPCMWIQDPLIKKPKTHDGFNFVLKPIPIGLPVPTGIYVYIRSRFITKLVYTYIYVHNSIRKKSYTCISQEFKTYACNIDVK
jgi:hypothetical protein